MFSRLTGGAALEGEARAAHAAFPVNGKRGTWYHRSTRVTRNNKGNARSRQAAFLAGSCGTLFITKVVNEIQKFTSFRREMVIKCLKWATVMMMKSLSHPVWPVLTEKQAGTGRTLLWEKQLGIDFTLHMAAWDWSVQKGKSMDLGVPEGEDAGLLTQHQCYSIPPTSVFHMGIRCLVRCLALRHEAEQHRYLTVRRGQMDPD